MNYRPAGVELHDPLHAWLDRFEPVANMPERGRRRDAPPCVVAIGKFDGIHLGHQALLREVVAAAGARGWAAGVVTFDAHPRRVLFGEAFDAVASLTERRRLLHDAGLDFQLLLHASPDLFALEADEFARRMLQTIDCRAVVMGTDFRFGRRAAGDSSTFTRLGVEVIAIDLCAQSGGKVSTTRVRDVLRRGDVEQASRLLGRTYGLSGRWHWRGQTQGTLHVDDGLLVPTLGTYLGRTVLGAVARPVLLRVAEPAADRSVAVSLIGPTPTQGRDGSVRGTVLFERRVGDAAARPIPKQELRINSECGPIWALSCP
jgi:riboflavin kinase/FMN adenylyltransferase